MEQKNELEIFIQESFKILNDLYDPEENTSDETYKKILDGASVETKQASDRAFAYLDKIQKYYHSARIARQNNITIEQWLDEQLKNKEDKKISEEEDGNFKRILIEVFNKAISK